MFDPFTLRSMINEHGVLVTLRKKATGVYNATTGKVTQAQTDYSVKAYFFNNDPSVGEFSIVSHGERRLLVSDLLIDGLTLTPEIDHSDEIIYGSLTTTVTRSSKITSNGRNMCQLLYLRD